MWEEFKRIFRNPRDIHRVMMVIPLAAMLSHIIYLYMSIPKGVPFTSDSIITASLGTFIYAVLVSWIFLSGNINIELFMRFFWTSLLAILAHRIGVMDNETGGSLYFKAVAYLAIGMAAIFAVTGKTKNELKIWFNVKLNEKSDKPPLHSVFNPDHDRNSDTG